MATKASKSGAFDALPSAEVARLTLAEGAARYVQNELLTLHGPCGHAFFDLDFADCFSLQCATCGVYFCAWCCGGGTSDRQLSHEHVGRCPQNRNAPYPDSGRKSYFGTREQFIGVHRSRRRKAVAAYLGGIPDAAVRSIAVRLLSRDLAYHGIAVVRRQGGSRGRGDVPCEGHGHEQGGEAAAAGPAHGHSHGGVPCDGHHGAPPPPAPGGGHGHSHGGAPCDGHHGPQGKQEDDVPGLV